MRPTPWTHNFQGCFLPRDYLRLACSCLESKYQNTRSALPASIPQVFVLACQLDRGHTFGNASLKRLSSPVTPSLAMQPIHFQADIWWGVRPRLRGFLDSPRTFVFTGSCTFAITVTVRLSLTPPLWNSSLADRPGCNFVGDQHACSSI